MYTYVCALVYVYVCWYTRDRLIYAAVMIADTVYVADISSISLWLQQSLECASTWQHSKPCNIQYLVWYLPKCAMPDHGAVYVYIVLYIIFFC